MRNLRVVGISDIPITALKLNAIVQCFLLFSLTISDVCHPRCVLYNSKELRVYTYGRTQLYLPLLLQGSRSLITT